MGVMRFLVPRRERVASDALARAYFTGLDEIPWQSRTEWNGSELAVRRAESDSGNFHIPWTVPGHGEQMLATACLMERDTPYHLPVELARGTLNRVRNQLAAWQQLGLLAPEQVLQRLAAANHAFSRAATQQQTPETAADDAEEALVAASDALVALSTAYSEQALAARRKQGSKLTTLLGVNLGSTMFKEPVQREIIESFNMAVAPLVWREIEAVEDKPDWSRSDRQIEWCRANNLRVCGGPLLKLDKTSLPNWIYLWEDDEENLFNFITKHIRETVSRYKGKVQLWQCAARMNVDDVLSLSEDQRLYLTKLTVETIRSIDGRAPITVLIDQPWAEFMGRQECDLSPLHFADALVRAEIGLSGIGLEINLARGSEATHPRDLLDFSRQLDRWSILGLPLVVSLTFPLGSGADPQAGRPAPEAATSDDTPLEFQCQQVQQLLPMLLAKQSVQAVIWNQLLDSAPHDYPHAGLFDPQDQPKPVVTMIKHLRRQLLA